jgi:antitoxin ParD1/3/4
MGMSTTTMSFALPEELRSYIDERVRSGQYGNTSEYMRHLIRRDQEEQAKKRLRELIEAGLESGAGRALTPKLAAELKKRALGNRR